MKKVLSLVLALVMVLCAASVLAEGSKTVDDNEGATNNGGGYGGGAGAAAAEEAISLVFTDDSEETAALIKQFKDAFDAGDVLAPLPEDIKGQLAGFTTVNEMRTAYFTGDTSKVTAPQSFDVAFNTQYEEGSEVKVLLNKGGAWTVVGGAGNAAGGITLEFAPEFIKAMGNDPFVLMVVSK